MARVPFVDLKNPYEFIRGEIEEAIRQVHAELTAKRAPKTLPDLDRNSGVGSFFNPSAPGDNI